MIFLRNGTSQTKFIYKKTITTTPHIKLYAHSHNIYYILTIQVQLVHVVNENSPVSSGLTSGHSIRTVEGSLCLGVSPRLLKYWSASASTNSMDTCS